MNSENLDIALFTIEKALMEYCDQYSIYHNIEVIFLGSQSILFYHKNISNDAIINSYEIDIMVKLEDRKKLEKISNLIDFVYGWGTELHEKENFYIDNMTDFEDNNSVNLKKFPLHWRKRATIYTTKRENISFTVISKEDLAILKLIANREKDSHYVKAMIQGSTVTKKDLYKVLNETNHTIDIEQKNRIRQKIYYYFSLKQINIFTS